MVAPQSIGSGGSSPEDLYRSLPPVSKMLLTAIVGTGVSTVLGICTPQFYALSFPLVWKKFNLWRVVTAGVFVLPSIEGLITTYSIGVFSIRLEKDCFSMGAGGGSADFAFTLMFAFVVFEATLLLLFYQPFLFFGDDGLLFYLAYVWSRKNPKQSVSFWGIGVSAPFVPWVLLAVKAFMGKPIFLGLMGIAIGHLFYFLVDVLPDVHGVDLLHTPRFLVNWLGWGAKGSGVYMEPPTQRRATGVRT